MKNDQLQDLIRRLRCAGVHQADVFKERYEAADALEALMPKPFVTGMSEAKYVPNPATQGGSIVGSSNAFPGYAPPSKAPEDLQATPRTDAEADRNGYPDSNIPSPWVPVEFARALERELNQKTAEISESIGYLTRLLHSRYPKLEILPTLSGICTQIDNNLAVALRHKTADLENFITQDRVKTKEINILVQENRELKHRLDEKTAVVERLKIDAQTNASLAARDRAHDGSELMKAHAFISRLKEQVEILKKDRNAWEETAAQDAKRRDEFASENVALIEQLDALKKEQKNLQISFDDLLFTAKTYKKENEELKQKLRSPDREKILQAIENFMRK